MDKQYPVKKGQEVTLTIDTLVYGGQGLGQIEGYKIFVPKVVPGDTVRVRISKRRSAFAEAKLLEVVEPSPKRTTPKCKHFQTCGGCQWQFLPYEEQVRIKGQHVQDAVSRLAGLDADLVRATVPCKEEWFYRNKMELSFGPGPDGTVMLGFYPPGYHFEVFNLEECFLHSPWLADLVAKVRDFANAYKIPLYRSDTHEGLLKNLIVREGKNTGERMIILLTSTSLFEHKDAFVKLFEDDASVTSLYWNTLYQVPGQPTWIEENLLLGKPHLTEKMTLTDGSQLEFDILPQAFFQTNTRQAEVLYSLVTEAAQLTGEELVFDLYCGTGTIGLFCAQKARQVVGIEINESAVESARSNALKNKIQNIQFYLGSVDARLATLTEKPDVVIVDPPRAGLGPEVTEKCAAFGAKSIVYVSCNPTSMARDLKHFAELGYRTEFVTPVDMFPQTHHIECVARLVKG